MKDFTNVTRFMAILGIVLICLIGTSIYLWKYGPNKFKNKILFAALKLTNNIFIIALIIGMVVYVAVPIAPFRETNDIVKQGEETIRTSLGDEFIIKYSTTNFPDYQTDVKVYDKLNNSLEYYYLEGDYVKPDFIVELNSSNLRCYEANKSLLIYSINGGTFNGIRRSQFDNEALTKKRPELIDLSKAMVEKNQWEWINFFGKFLLKSGDSEIRKILERHALGNFTKEELEVNKNSAIKKEDMVTFAKQALQQK